MTRFASPRSISPRSFGSSDGSCWPSPSSRTADVVAVRERVLEARLHGSADADVERESQDGRSVRLGHLRGLIRRRIVDDDDVERHAVDDDLVDDARRSHPPRSTPARLRRASGALMPAPGRPSSTSSSSRRARWAYVCSSSTRSRARRPSPRPGPGPRRARDMWRAASSARLDDDELAAGLEPPLDALVRVRDDRRAGRGKLERPRRRRAGHGRVRAAGHVQVDARSRDRAGEHVERDVAEAASPLRYRPGSRGRPVRSRARARASTGSPTMVSSSPAGTCRRSRRRRRPSSFSTGCGAKNSGSAPQKSASARRAPSSSRLPIPPSEFETTRSYSDGSAPW